jgi:hypothetical protein
VRARVLNAGTWSALTEAQFYTPQDFRRAATERDLLQSARRNERGRPMSSSSSSSATSARTRWAGGLSFTEGIAFTFTNGTTLAPGAFLVLARNAAQFAARFPGVAVARASTPGGSTTPARRSRL